MERWKFTLPELLSDYPGTGANIEMNSNTAPAFLWLAGIEGSGHHLVRNVLCGYLNRREVIDKGPHYPLLIQRWDSEQSRMPQAAVRRTLGAIFHTYATAGITTIYEDTSFPFGGVESGYEEFASGGVHRGPLRCPDILDMIEVLDGCTNLRILVTYRSPLLTVSSALRRGFSASPHFECRLAEAVHLQITNQLKGIPPACYRTIRFEDFVQRPDAYVKPLADWWMIPPDDVRSGISAIRAAGTVHDIPPRNLGVLSEYFTEKRVEQWQATYQKNPLITS